MPESRQFSIATHIMSVLGHAAGPVTSNWIAQSVNTSPSFVRRVLARLSRAGLVQTSTGKNGSATLAKRPEKITLLEIYRAVDAPRAFAIHEYPEQAVCPVSCGIKASLNSVLERTQQKMESGLAEITLADVLKDI